MVRKVNAKEVKKSSKKKEIELVEELQSSVKKGVKNVKEKIENGVGKFSKEIEIVKKSGFNLISRIKENWNIILGIPFLSFGLWKLGDLIIGGIFIIIGIFLITGYIGKSK